MHRGLVLFMMMTRMTMDDDGRVPQIGRSASSKRSLKNSLDFDFHDIFFTLL